MDTQLVFIVAAIAATAGCLWLAVRKPADETKGPSMAAVKRYAAAGEKDRAIQEYRELTGTSLDDAKAFIEAL